MIKRIRRAVVRGLIVLAACTAAARAGDWTAPVVVRHELRPCVSYRARLAGEFLVVQATLEPGWHTFAMDNKQRAREKLAGRQSLGIDAPTEITVSRGLQVGGPWYQSPPTEFSKPELLWFSWVFEGQALFVAKVRRWGPGPARIAVGGQACTDTTCKQIDIAISLPLGGGGTGAGRSGIDLKSMVRVRPLKQGRSQLEP